MTTTLETQPAYIALASSVDYVETSIYGPLLLLGISGDLVSADVQRKLRQREVYTVYTSAQAAADDLVRRIEWAMELHGRKPATRAACLAGMSAIVDTAAPLLDWRDTRQRIAVMRDRLVDRVERDRAVGSVPKSIQLDAGQQRIASLEKQVAELQAQLQQLTSTTPASA